MELNKSFNQSRFRQYADYLKSQGLSDATISRKLSSLSTFQKFLVKRKLVEPTTTEVTLQKTIEPTKTAPSSQPFYRYLLFVLLFLLLSGLGYGLYTQVILKAKTNLAYSTATSPVRSGRVISFQGRLTDSSGNPITSSTGILFELYTAGTGGTQVYTSSVGNSQTVVPDENGIFSVVIGRTHGTEIPSSVFSENPEVWLQIISAGETMTPRQQIATVGYAMNAETLQGLPPSASGTKNTVLIIDELGNLNLGETSPTIKSTSGTLGIEGQAVLIKATDGSGGNITINPDANGIIKLVTEGAGSTAVGGQIELTNANLATGNLIGGVINNDNRGYNFIQFRNYNVGTTQLSTRFSVDANGNITSNSLSVGSSTLSTNFNADLLDGYHYNNLPYTNYQSWVANVGTSNNNINSGSTISYVAGAGVAISMVGNTITFTNTGVGTTYSFTNGLTNTTNLVGLGGTLTQNTRIGVSSFSLNFTNSIPLLSLNPNGTVGIGTSSPTARLEIVGNGTTAASFKITNGYVDIPAGTKLQASTVSSDLLFYLPLQGTHASSRGDYGYFTRSDSSSGNVSTVFTDSGWVSNDYLYSNIPRFEKSYPGRGVWSENSRRNILLYTSFEDGSTAGWTNLGVETTGVSTTYRKHNSYSAFLNDTGSGGLFYQNFTSAVGGTLAIGGTYPFSCYALNIGNTRGVVDSSTLQLYANGNISTTYTPAEGGWYRLTGFFSPITNVGNTIGVNLQANQKVYLDACQLESESATMTGTTSPYNTTYMYNNGGANQYNRGEETLYYYGWRGTYNYESTDTIIEANKGTISFWFKPDWGGNQPNTDLYLFQVPNVIQIFYQASSDSIVSQMYNGSNWTTVSVQSAAQSFAAGTDHFLSFRWDNTVGTTLNLDGVETNYTGTWTAQGQNITTSTLVYVGSKSTTGSRADALISDFAIFGRSLTNSEVNQIFHNNAPIEDFQRNDLITLQQNQGSTQRGNVYITGTVGAGNLSTTNLTSAYIGQNNASNFSLNTVLHLPFTNNSIDGSRQEVGSFSRPDPVSGSATVMDESSFELVNKGTNEPRIDRGLISNDYYRNTGVNTGNEGIYIEDARQNIVLDSSFENLGAGGTSTSWNIATGSTASSQTFRVFHGGSAVNITSTAASRYFQTLDLSTLAAGTTMDISVYAYRNESGAWGSSLSTTYLSLYARTDDGLTPLSTTYTPLGNGWYRLTANFISTAANNWDVGVYLPSSGRNIIFDAFQVERRTDNSSTFYPSTYISTGVGSTGIRAAEQLSYTLPDSFKPEKGGFSLWFRPTWSQGITGDTSTKYFLYVPNTIRVYSVGTSIKVEQYNIGTSAWVVTANTTSSIINRYSWNNFTCGWYYNYNYCRINGNSFSSSAGWTPNRISVGTTATIYVGSDNTGANQVNSQISGFTIFDTYLTPEQQTQLYYNRGKFEDYFRTDQARLTNSSSSSIQSGSLYLTGNFRGGLGTVIMPTFSFNSDTDTGMFSPDANAIGFSVGGTEALHISSNGTVTANTNFNVGGTFVSVGSTNLVTNLNANYLGGFSAAALNYQNWVASTGTSSVAIGSTSGLTFTGSTGLQVSLVGNTLTFTNTGLGTTYAVTNGLSFIGTNTIGLGGTLTQNTQIDTSSFNLSYLGLGGSQALYVSSAGNVGIGTTNPTEKLTLGGNLRLGGNNLIFGNVTGTNMGIYFNTSGDQSYFIGRDSTAWSNTPLVASSYYGWRFRTSNADALLINTAGNVGIGNTNPLNKLDVTGNINANGLVKSTGSNFVFTMDATNGGGPRLSLGTTTVSNSFFELGAWNNINNFDSKNRDLRLFTASNNGIYLNQAGNVGIGTTNPQAALEVNGGIAGTSGGNSNYIDQGRNVTPWDQSFETGSLGWGSINNTTVGITNSDFYEGAQSLRIRRVDLVGGGGATYTLGQNLKPGRNYILSGYYKTYNGSSTFSVQLRFNGSNTYTGGTTVQKTLPASASWTYFAINQVALSVGASNNYAWLGYGIGDTTQEVMFDNLTFTEGSIAPIQSSALVSNITGTALYSLQNLGLGTTNPLYQLDMTGSLRIGGTFVSVGSTNLVTNLNANYLNGYSYNNLPYDNYQNWRLQTNGAGTTNINSNALVNFVNGTGTSLVQSGSTITINSIGTTYAATNGLFLNGSNQFGLGGTLTQNTQIGTSSFNLSFLGLGGTQGLFQSSNGSVGIGTTNPTKKLSINGDVKLSNNSALYFQDNTTNDIGVMSYTTGNNLQFDNPSGSMNFSLNGGGDFTYTNSWTETMRLTSNNRVGIGTTSPSSKVTIVGIGNTDSTSSLKILNSSGNVSLFVDDASRLSIGTSSIPSWLPTNSAYISGTVRAGTFSANSGSAFTWGDGKQYIRGTDNYGVSIFTNSLERLTVGFSGNIGIGNTNPLAKLDINGNLNVGTSATIGTNLSVGGSITAANLPINVGTSILYIDNSGIVSKGLLQAYTAGVGISISSSNVINNIGVTSIIGTANQIFASGSTGAVTLSLPQGIGITSNVQFNNLTLGGTFVSVGSTNLVTNLNANYLNGYSYNNLPYFSTATNGLTAFNATTVGLGSSLTQNTSIGVSSFSLSFLGLGGTQALYISSSGNVGIGTTNPLSKLSVGGSGDASSAIFGQGNGGSIYYGIHGHSDDNDGSGYGVYGTGGAGGVYGSGPLGVLGVGQVTGVRGDGVYGVSAIGTSFDFYTDNNSGKSYFAGLVGIGTTNPLAKLDVNGNLNIGTSANIGTNLKIGGTLVLPQGAQNNFVLTSDASGNARWAANSSVGTTYAATNGISINVGATNVFGLGGTLTRNTQIGTSSFNLSFLGLGNTLGLSQAANGYVGIGTSSPASTLDVNGAGNFNGQLSSTSFLINAANAWNTVRAVFGGKVGIGNTSTASFNVSTDATIGTNLTVGGTFVSVGSTNLVTNLNANYLNGYTASNLPLNLQAGAGIGISGTSIGTTVYNTGVISLVGTTNQVNISASTGNITLSLPQDIGISSTPTFNSLNIASTGLITNLNADMLDGKHATDFLSSTAGWNLQANGTGTTLVNTNATVNFIGGTGISLVQNGSSITINGTSTNFSAVNGISFLDPNNLGLGGTLTQNTAIGTSSFSLSFLGLGNSQSLYLSSSGNVGFGFTAPFTKNTTVGTESNVSFNRSISVSDTGTTIVSAIGSTFSNDDIGKIILWTDGTPRTVVGVNFTSPEFAFIDSNVGTGATLTASVYNTNFYIDSSGKVGVGTANVTTMFQVNGTMSASRYTGLYENSRYFFDPANTTSYNSSLSLHGNGSLTFNAETINGVPSTILATASTRLKSFADGFGIATNIGNTGIGSTIIWNEALYVKNNGNVGIGTSNPQARLHIAAANSVITNTAGDITLNAASGSISLSSNQLINFSRTFAGSGSPISPAYSFASSINTGIYSPNNDVLGIATSGIDRLVIDNNGLITVGQIGISETYAAIQSANGLNYQDLAINPNGGRISIGSTTFNSLLRIDGTVGNTDSGLLLTPTFVGTSTSNVAGRVLANFNSVTATGGLYGFDIRPQFNATVGGTQAAFYGVLGIPQVGPTATQTVENQFAGFFRSDNYSSSGAVINNNYNLYIANPNSTGTINNNYGLYIAAQTSGSNNDYGLYSAGGTNVLMDNVGVGTANPLNKLHVQGTTGGSAGIYLNSAIPNSTAYTLYNNAGTLMWNGLAIGTSGSSLSGTINYLSKFTTASTLGNSVIYDNGSFVGIGNTNPTVPLTVMGAGGIQNNVYGSEAGLTVQRANGTLGAPTQVLTDERIAYFVGGAFYGGGTTGFTNTTAIDFRAAQNQADTGRGSYMRFDTTGIGVTARSEKMRLTGNGNVGIGTTNPLSKLEAYSLGTTNFLGLEHGAISINNPYTGAANNSLDFVYSGSGSTAPVTRIGSLITATGSYLNFGTSNNYASGITNLAMSITPSGYVGIGTTNPALKLDVQGPISLGKSGQYDAIIRAVSDSNLYFQTGGSNTRMMIDTSGNVGIGTTSPTAKLQVAGNILPTDNLVYDIGSSSLRWNNIWAKTLNIGSSTWSLQSPDNSRLAFFNSSVGGTEAMTILSNGFVGIGTTSPISPLQIKIGNTEVFSVRTNGNVGVGTTSPLNALHVQGTSGGSAGIYMNNAAPATVTNTLYNNGGNLYWNGTALATGAAVSGTAGYLSRFSGPSALGNSTIFDNGSEIGIGTTNPTTKLSLSTNSTGQIALLSLASNFAANDDGSAIVFKDTNDIGSNGAAGIGSVAYDLGDAGLVFLTNNGSGLTERARFTAAGNFGIGTTSPGGKLTISDGVIPGGNATYKGDLQVFSYMGSLDENGGIELKSTDWSNGYGWRMVSPDLSNKPIIFQNRNNSASWSNMITFDNSGNVGIGTTSPKSKFHVQRSDSGCGAQCFSDAAIFENNGNSYLQIIGSTTGERSLAFGDPSNGVDGGIKFNAADGVANGLSFTVNGNQTKMVINSSGNVGIGTTGPTATLDVNGSMKVSSSTTGDTMLIVGNTSASGRTYGWYSSGATSTIGPAGSLTLWDTAVGSRMTVTSNGNVGIGTTNPLTKFHIGGDAFIGGGSNTRATGGVYAALDINYMGGGTQYGIEFIPGANTTIPLYFSNAAGSGVGNVSITSTNTAYNTTSDRRLKENIVNTAVGLDTLMDITVRDFNFIADTDKKTVQGFIAQELYNVYPEAVTVGGDDSSKNPWSVDYGRLSPLLVRSIQDLKHQLDNIQVANNGQIDITSNINQSVLASLGYADSKNEIETATYSITGSTGKAITTVGQYAKASIASLQAGLVNTTNLIAKNIVAESTKTKTLNTAVITPLSDITDTITIDGNASVSGTLTAKDATITGTLYAENIISKNGSFSQLMTDKITALREEIRASIAAIGNTDTPVASPSALLADSATWSFDTGTSQTTLNGSFSLTDNLVVGGKLAVVGDAQLGNAFITGTFTAGEIAIKDNFIETVNTALYIQPSNNGSVHLMGDTLVIAENGEVTVNGSMQVTGKFTTNMLVASDIQSSKANIIDLTTTKLNVATESAETIIASSSFAELATSSAKMTSNAAAGIANLPAGKTELVINNKNLTPNSIVYLTPAGSTDNQVVYLKSKFISPTPSPVATDLSAIASASAEATSSAVAKLDSFFTIAIDQPLVKDININWWIIN